MFSTVFQRKFILYSRLHYKFNNESKNCLYLDFMFFKKDLSLLIKIATLRGLGMLFCFRLCFGILRVAYPGKILKKIVEFVIECNFCRFFGVFCSRKKNYNIFVVCFKILYTKIYKSLNF